MFYGKATTQEANAFKINTTIKPTPGMLKVMSPPEKFAKLASIIKLARLATKIDDAQ